MKLRCYLQNRAPLDIRPAGLSRKWMDNSIERFAYRCLPLNIANTHGWEIYCTSSFKAIWNGGKQSRDISIESQEATCEAITHFGSGVLTFHVPCVFRTEPGWNLMVMGPPNCPKRGIQALTGLIETDWSPYSFTMNWIFTEPNYEIEFKAGEPFCFFYPLPARYIEHIQPSFCDMKTNEDLHKEYSNWIESRKTFIKDLSQPHSEAQEEKWQRKYFHGLRMDGQTGCDNHLTKLKVKAFVNESS